VIDKLDPLNKALLLLYLDGHSYSEIGEVLGIGASNVGTKIGRLKKTMQQEWSQTGPV
jgi:RNA polymerase sigma-70 factor (ECF subfamily)